MCYEIKRYIASCLCVGFVIIPFMVLSTLSFGMTLDEDTSERIAKLLRCTSGDKVLETLQQEEIDINAFLSKSYRYHSLLQRAIVAKNASAVVSLIQAGANIKQKGLNGDTALKTAVDYNHADSVRELLRHGALVGVYDVDTDTLLHRAWSAEVAEMLILAGVDVEAKDKYSLTPLEQNIIDGNKEMVDIFLRFGAERSDIVNIALDKPEECNIEQIKNKWLPSSPPCDDDCFPILFIAVGWEATNSVEALIRAGVDVNVRGFEESTALHVAYATANLQMAKLLIGFGADLFAKDAAGREPVEYFDSN